MRAKITHGGVTVELEDATAEDVERVLSAIGQRDVKPPVKELAPTPRLPMINPLIGDPFPYLPMINPLIGDPFPYLPVTYCASGDSAEVCS